jgi:hypothetical protein
MVQTEILFTGCHRAAKNNHCHFRRRLFQPYCCNSFRGERSGVEKYWVYTWRKIPLRSPTLQHAMDHGMEIIYVDRETFRDKTSIRQKYSGPGFYW